MKAQDIIAEQKKIVSDQIQKKHDEMVSLQKTLDEGQGQLQQVEAEKHQAVVDNNQTAYTKANNARGILKDRLDLAQDRLSFLGSGRIISQEDAESITKAVTDAQEAIIADQNKKLQSLIQQIEDTIDSTTEALKDGNKVLADLHNELYENRSASPTAPDGYMVGIPSSVRNSLAQSLLKQIRGEAVSVGDKVLLKQKFF